MTAPTRIRATIRDGIADVRVLMSHEMKTGQRVEGGRAMPARFINEVVVGHNGRVVMAAQWGPAISRNPYAQFRFRGAAAGDKLSIKWTDDRGETRTDEAVIG